MADRIFCVDFGSAFTKVALRTAPQEDGALVPCSDAGLELWAPTVVAADWTRSKTEPRLEFGYRAADTKPSAKIQVYSNFKKELFAPPPAGPTVHPLDSLLQSQDFEELATKHGVLPSWVAGLRALAGAAKSMFGADSKGVSPEAKKQEDAKKLAYLYFKWLRERVLEACARLPHTALKYEDIPLRVSVPLLGSGPDLNAHPGCVRLREVLEKAGWQLDLRPFVSEPESNAIGVLSKGVNRLKKGKIDMTETIGKTPTNIAGGDKNFPTYRALVIDVGAFTTDFAALTIDNGGKESGVETDSGLGFQTVQHSVAFGVTDLDAAVRAGLSEERRAAVDALARKDFAEFQNSAYTEGKGYRKPGVGVIGGDTDQPAIQAAITNFAARLTSETAKFCQALAPASRQELILTGGGNSLPSVRDALIKSATQAGSNTFVRIHAPNLKKTKTAPHVDNLDDKLARGASALGGASIYFEKSYY